MNTAFVCLSMKNQGNDYCSEVHFDHLCAISACLVICFLYNRLLKPLLDNSMLFMRKHDTMISILSFFPDLWPRVLSLEGHNSEFYVCRRKSLRAMPLMHRNTEVAPHSMGCLRL
jgi:hypothetical protein